MKLGLAYHGGPPPAQLLDLLERAGLPAGALRAAVGPALVDVGEVTWLLAPGADVLEACVRGALDAGIAGKDLLLELAPPVHELLDLRVCNDVLVYATPEPAAGASHRGRPVNAARASTRAAPCLVQALIIRLRIVTRRVSEEERRFPR